MALFLTNLCFQCWDDNRLDDMDNVVPGRAVDTLLRVRSLITGRGGLQNGRGGHVKFYPYEKGGRKKF